MKNKHLLFTTMLLLQSCGPEELQEFEYYVINPDRLTKAVKFCVNPGDSSHRDYCTQINGISTCYQAIEEEFSSQQMLYFQYGGFYPEIDKKTRKSLAEAKQLLELKRQGLKRNS